jgi:hypothetical protein
MGYEPLFVVLWWLIFFFPCFMIEVVFCIIVKLDLFCFVYIYISLHKFDDN